MPRAFLPRRYFIARYVMLPFIIINLGLFLWMQIESQALFLLLSPKGCFAQSDRKKKGKRKSKIYKYISFLVNKVAV
jgi:hypothetical protein